MKRFLSFTLVAALLLLLVPIGITPISANAATGGSEGFTYEVQNGKATITGYTGDNLYVLEIPSTIDGYPVVEIGASAFFSHHGIVYLYIPEGVETIGVQAFAKCQNLYMVEFPDSLISIEKEAFFNCTKLTDIWFGDNLKTIGYGAFSHCYHLDAILRFPSNLESIGACAFYDCNSLIDVTLPDSLKELGLKAFAMCDRLEFVDLPSNLEKLGANAFYQTACYNLSYHWFGDVFYLGPYLLDAKASISGSYEVYPGVTHIADEAFANCDGLTEIILTEDLRIIGAGAFEDCDGLQTVVFPSGATTIGDEAFCDCSALSNMQIPDSVTYIGQDAFKKTAFYDSTENWENGVLYAGDCLIQCKSSVSGVLEIRPGTKTIAAEAMKERTKITEIILPDTLSTIGEKAFYGCSGLKSIRFGKSVSAIGTGAFSLCSGLENIALHSENEIYQLQDNCLIHKQDQTLVLGCKTSRIPADGSVTQIGAFAFEGCTSLSEIAIPDTISHIGEGAFRDCNGLKTVKLGNGVQIVGKRAFEECDVLSQIDLGQSVHTIDDHGFAYNHRITHVDFPVSLRYLGEEAFSNATGLVSLNFQEGLQSIGKNCFYFCETLTQLHLPDSLTEIKAGAFYGCEKIAEIAFGNRLTTIGSSAFDGCKALATLTIPESVHTIENSAFYECTSLQELDLGQVKKIGYSAFESCTSLKEIHIPASVTDLGQQAFAYCSAVEKMTVSHENPVYHSQENCIIHTEQKYLLYGCKNSVIPADGSVTALQSYSFAGCTDLKRIEVPDQITRIEAYTFYGCHKLTYMKLPFVGGSKNSDNYIGYIFGGGPSQNDLFVPGTLLEIVITGGTVVGDSGFKNCRYLQKIVLPESITSIGYYAFANCPKLDNVVVPGNLQTIKHGDIFDGTPYAMMQISYNQENTIALVKSYDIRHQIGGVITFVDEENHILSSQWYAVNRVISAPAVGEKPADDRYTYEAVWDPMPDRCTGNQTIHLRYIPHWNGEVATGDLTGDGNINSLDGLLLMRYLNGWNVDITSPEAMDVNGDGKINSLDGLILMRYLNGWNVTLG